MKYEIVEYFNELKISELSFLIITTKILPSKSLLTKHLDAIQICTSAYKKVI